MSARCRIFRLAASALEAPVQFTVVQPDGSVSIGPVTFGPAVVKALARAFGVASTLVVAYFLLRLVPVLERLVLHGARSNETPGAEVSIERRQRVETLTRVSSNIARTAIWGLTIISVLGEVGITIAPLLAGAGIAGVAVGFGAQSIIKDFFAGFFILLENQFTVGDTITVAGVTGKVERMTLRMTLIRDATGTAFFFPNSAIANVANRSYEYSKSTLDVVFSAAVSDDAARDALEAIARRVNEDPKLEGAQLEPIKVEGPIDFAAGAMTLRLAAKTRPDRASAVKQALILALRAELEARNLSYTGNAIGPRKVEEAKG